ncbi:MAG: hypothetical protein F4213_13175 [Boseongicola sp. SB0677_bin_26]|nr:hypothetical protein [Boseongicola sp. SB0665_bin_10]MYG26952.1 hypothetical protein [Boseongicola sp. SB0677_bin_26]
MTAPPGILIPAAIDVTAPDEILGLGECSAALVLSLDSGAAASLDGIDDHSRSGDMATFEVRHASCMAQWRTHVPEETPALADLDKMQALAERFLPLLQRVHAGLAPARHRREAGTDDARDASDEIARIMHDADWTRDVDICHVSEWTDAGERIRFPAKT